MWLYLKKKEVTDNTAIYTYGYNSKEQTGIIKFSFDKGRFFMIKKADKDVGDDGYYTLKHLYGRFYRNIKARKFENEFMLAFN